MQTKIGTISSLQLFCILFLSRIIATFTYILNLHSNTQNGDRPAIMAFFAFFTLLLSIPVFLVLGKGEKQSLLQKTSVVSPGLAKILALGYCAEFLWSAGIALTRFGLFAGTVLFQQTELLPYVVLLLVVAIFCATKGIEPLGRASVIFTVVLLASMLFITLTLLGKIDPLNISHPLYDGLPPVLQEAFISSCRNLEVVSILLVAPRISGNIGKGFVRWIFLFSGVVAVIFTIIGGVTGKYGDEQLFPLYTLTALAEFSILERMDDLLTGLWVICALIKIAYFLFIAVLCLEQGFEKKASKGVYAGAGAIVLGIYILLTKSIRDFTAVLRSPANQVLYLAFGVFIPLALAITFALFGKLNRRKREGKSA